MSNHPFGGWFEGAPKLEATDFGAARLPDVVRTSPPVPAPAVRAPGESSQSSHGTRSLDEQTRVSAGDELRLSHVLGNGHKSSM